MSGHWAKGYLGLAGDGPSMGDIEGINISNPQNGDTLVYNSSTGKWENGSGGGGGGSLVIHTVSGTLDKTWQEIYDALEAGVRCIVMYGDEGKVGQTIIQEAYWYDDNDYRIYPFGDGSTYYVATSASGYPERNMS